MNKINDRNVPDAPIKPIMAKDVTLRDIFAGHALNMILLEHADNYNSIAEDCYAIADAMIKARG